MNITPAKNAAEIMKRGGFLYLTEYDSTKDIDLNIISYLSADVALGATNLLPLFVHGIFTSGTVNYNTEQRTFALSGATMTITATTAAVSKGEELYCYQDGGYTTFVCVGHSEETTFNAGNPEETYIVNEVEENVGAFADSSVAPVFTHRVLQSGIDQLAIACAKDVETSTENGATVISNTALTDYAGLYVTQRLTAQGTKKYYVIKFPHLKISTSPDVMFTPNEKTTLELQFKVLYDAVADYDYKILEVG